MKSSVAAKYSFRSEWNWVERVDSHGWKVKCNARIQYCLIGSKWFIGAEHYSAHLFWARFRRWQRSPWRCFTHGWKQFYLFSAKEFKINAESGPNINFEVTATWRQIDWSVPVDKHWQWPQHKHIWNQPNAELFLVHWPQNFSSFERGWELNRRINSGSQFSLPQVGSGTYPWR